MAPVPAPGLEVEGWGLSGKSLWLPGKGVAVLKPVIRLHLSPIVMGQFLFGVVGAVASGAVGRGRK